MQGERIMKILSNTVWNAILDIARENDKKIKELETENKRLKKDLSDLQRFCMNFATDHKELDFPNSHDHKAIMPDDKIY